MESSAFAEGTTTHRYEELEKARHGRLVRPRVSRRDDKPPVARPHFLSYPRAFSGTFAASATFTHTCTCGAPR